MSRCGVYKEGLPARKKGKSSTPPTSTLGTPFPSPSFSFSFHLLHLSCRLQQLGLRMLIPHFCLGNYAQSPTSQQRVEQWFLTIFESQAPWRPLNSARCYTLLWSPSTNPEQQPRWGTSKWQVRRWTRFCSFLFFSTLLLRAVLGPLPLLLKMSENRPTDKEWRYQGGKLKNKTNGKLMCKMGFPGGASGKELSYNTGDTKDAKHESILGSGRSPGAEHGNPLQWFLPGKSHGQRSLEGYSP